MTPVILELPGGPVTFRRLVLDFTGTLSLGGELIPGVAERLRKVSERLTVTVVTADTFGSAREQLKGLPVGIELIGDGREKADVVSGLGPDTLIAVGNGRNDAPMMGIAGLGIAIMGPEGAAAELLSEADVVVHDINHALDLVLDPLRVKATLRD
ncbi:MAG: ATPase P [Gemmatimonadetes bacterium]|nr:ATPase P [Gemmatimonadota bacterium]NNM07423.1 ATPase P [Gemmatimonadota bacterium]